MTSKERHENVAKQFTKLNKSLHTKKDEYLEQISHIINKAIKNYENKELWDQSLEQIIDIFYEALTETYLNTVITLKNVFEDISDDIPNIEDFFYKDDGKTLIERITGYWDEVYSMLNTSFSYTQDMALYLLSMDDRILETEMQHVQTGIKKIKRPIDYDDFIMVIEITDGECCDYGGLYLEGEEPGLPPYHPNCQCIWWPDLYDPNDPDDKAVLEEAGWEEEDE